MKLLAHQDPTQKFVWYDDDGQAVASIRLADDGFDFSAQDIAVEVVNLGTEKERAFVNELVITAPNATTITLPHPCS